MLKCKFDIFANTKGIDEGSEPATLQRISIPFDIFFRFFLFLQGDGGRGGGGGGGDDVMVGVLCCTTAAALSSIPARAEGGQARPQMDSV